MADWVDHVRVATTGNLAALSGLLTIDGVTVAVNDRVLVKNQTTAKDNGLYSAASGAWSRTADTIRAEIAVRVSEGTANAHTEWFLGTQGVVTVGTTPLVFAQFVASGAYDSIGTLASPGALRGIVGTTGNGVEVSGFWTKQDGGGGAFIWDATSLLNDDQGTIIRPTAIGPSSPGRWLRVISGFSLPVEAFGAKGDATKNLATTGTDDAPAFNAAAAWATATSAGFPSSRKLVCDPRKAYKLASGINFDGSQGVQLSCEGGARYIHGAWLKFIGAMDGALISAKSTMGFHLTGFQVDCTNVTEPVPDFSFADVNTMNTTPRVAGDVGKIAKVSGTDFTYANEAARLASSHTAGDVGKTALQSDSLMKWVIYEVVGTTAKWGHTSMRWRLATASPVLWLPWETCAVDLGHTNYNGYLGPEGSDSSFAEIAHCAFGGASSPGFSGHNIYAGVRMPEGFNHRVYMCQFVNLDNGVTGTDYLWGGGFSHVNHVECCMFQQCDDAGIFAPGEGWSISACTFEPTTTGGKCCTIWDPNIGGIKSGLFVYGNFWSDGGHGTNLDLVGRRGASIVGNRFFADTAIRLGPGCYGIASSGNAMVLTTTAYSFDGTAIQDATIGPDYYAGMAYISGSVGNGTCVHTSGGGGHGLAFGPGCVVNNASNSFALGSGCVASGAFSTTIGFNSVASASAAGAFVHGACGTAVQGGQYVQSNGLLYGQGGTQYTRLGYNATLAASTTTTLVNQDGNKSPSLVGTNLKSYTIEFVIFVASPSGAARNARVTIRQRVQCYRDNSGVMHIDTPQPTPTVDDPGATGITATVTVSNGGLDISVNNTLAQQMHCYAYSSAGEVF